MERRTVFIGLAGVALVVFLIWRSRSGTSQGSTIIPGSGNGAGGADPNSILQARSQGFSDLAQLVASDRASAHELDLAKIQASTELERTALQSSAELGKAKLDASTTLSLATMTASLSKYGLDIQRDIELGREDSALKAAALQNELERDRLAVSTTNAQIQTAAELAATRNQNSNQTKQMLIQTGGSIISSIIQAYGNRNRPQYGGWDQPTSSRGRPTMYRGPDPYQGPHTLYRGPGTGLGTDSQGRFVG